MNTLSHPCLFFVSPQLVLWATSSQFLALFPALCVPPTAEPARRDQVCVNVAAAFIGLLTMPTPLPAQVSFVCMFVYIRPSGMRVRASLESFVIGCEN